MASVQKRPTGKWRARYRDAEGKEHARHFPRKVDAQRWLDEITTDVMTGRYVDPRAGDVTFAEYLQSWADLQVWKPRTALGYDRLRRTVPFADKPLRDLTPTDIEAWRKQLVAEGYAPQTINNRLGSVRTVLKAAVSDRRINVNPAAGVKGVRVDGRSKRVQVPPASAVAAILREVEPRMRAYVALASFAGLRLGEISGIKVEDIDFLPRVLHVRRQVQASPGGPPEVREPKYESVRDVPLPDELLQLLAHHIETYGASTEGYLFSSGSGRPLPPSTVNYWWRRTTAAAGVRGVRLHDLRHYYASGLIAAGCDVVTVQRALGHSKPSTTLDFYSHLWPDAEDRTRAAASKLMSGVDDSSPSIMKGA